MRINRLLGNWFFILTSPIWVLPVFFTLAIQMFLSKNKRDLQTWRVLTGQEWIV